jgi:hypothetical protein
MFYRKHLAFTGAFSAVLLILAVSVANAGYVHTHTYFWYDNGATVVVEGGIPLYTFGDPTGGNVVAKIQEMYYENVELGELGPAVGNYTAFRYNWWNEGGVAGDVFGYMTVFNAKGHQASLMKPGGVIDFSTFTVTEWNPLGDWEADGGLDWTWTDQVPGDPASSGPGLADGLVLDGNLGLWFEGYTGWTFGTGEIRATEEDGAGVLYTGVISAPAEIPEPGTLLLLGGSLVGLAGYARLKRKKS